MTKILSVNIENYRPFYKTIELNFSTVDSKNFNVIYAGTGGGKTTLLDAISWCLFGKEPHKDLTTESMLNDITESGLQNEETVDVAIEIILGQQQDDIEGVFRRKITFFKNNQGKVIPLPGSEKFSAKIKDTRNNLIDATDASIAANRVFPEKIQHLFMFDGEKLERFFDTDNMKKTENAIKDMTQMDQLDNAINHLKSVSREFVSKKDQKDPQLQEIEAYISGLTNRITDREIQKKEMEIKRGEAKSRFDELDEQLRKLNSKGDLEQLLAEQRKNETKRNELNRKLIELENRKFDHLLKGIPTIFCKNELEDAINKINKKYESGELPPDIKIDFINRLLQKERCICHTELTEGSAARKYVEAYKNKAPLSLYEPDIRKGQSEINLMLKGISTFFEKRGDFYHQINEIKDQLFDIRQILEKLNQQIASVDDKAFQSVKSNRDFFLSEFDKCAKKVGELTSSINEDQLSKLGFEKARQNIQKKLIKDDEMRKKFEICEAALNFLQDAQKSLLIELKTDIEARTNEIYKNSILEPRVEKIIITEDFELQALDSDGENIYNQLSKGQKQGLATAFMIALRRDSDFNSPILFDYPLGRIDFDTQAEFIKSLKTILTDVQVLFFLIVEREWNNITKIQMKDKLGSVYELKKLKNEKRSEVIQHA
jgi:DNA sulfur modification protein DndD